MKKVLLLAVLGLLLLIAFSKNDSRKDDFLKDCKQSFTKKTCVCVWDGLTRLNGKGWDSDPATSKRIGNMDYTQQELSVFARCTVVG